MSITVDLVTLPNGTLLAVVIQRPPWWAFWRPETEQYAERVRSIGGGWEWLFANPDRRVPPEVRCAIDRAVAEMEWERFVTRPTSAPVR